MKLFLLALALLVAPACKTTAPEWMNLPPIVEQNGVRVHTDGVKRVSFWFVGITGEATNVSGGDLESCTIRFDCINALGKKVGTAIAECDEFEDGASWTFTASFEESDVRDIEIVAAPVVRVQRAPVR